MVTTGPDGRPRGRRISITLVVTALAAAAGACTATAPPMRRPSTTTPPPSPSAPTSPEAAPGQRFLSGASPFAACAPLGTTTRGSEVEPSIAADPTGRGILVGSWQQDRNLRGAAQGIVTATSLDAGRTWRTSLPPLTRCSNGPYGLASDPVVAIGTDRIYLGDIAVSRDLKRDDVVVSTSTDDGRTWGAPVVVRRGGRRSPDKETLVADPRSPGLAYVAWVEYPPGADEAGHDVAFASRTTDGGRTWSRPARVYGASSETQFHQLAVMPDGALLDAFVEGPSLSGHPPPPLTARIAVVRSSDGGRTWGKPVTAEHVTFDVIHDPTGRDGVRATTATIGFVVGGGALYLAWTAGSRGAGRVLVSRSVDEGRSWSTPVVVAGATGPAFLPAVAAGERGSVGVVWYAFERDRHGGPASADVMGATSTDGGATWRTSRLAGPFDLHTARLTREGDFVGDYVGIAPAPGGFAALFAVSKPLSRAGSTDVVVDVLPA